MVEEDGRDRNLEAEADTASRERKFSWLFLVLAIVCFALGFFKALFFGTAIVFIVLAFNWHKWDRRKREYRASKQDSQSHEPQGHEERPLDRW